MPKLTIRYEPDPTDEVGKLWFDIETSRFSGTGFFWSNLSEVPAIVAALRQYPISRPVCWKWGYNASEGDDAVLSLSIAQTDLSGALKATVEIADLYAVSNRLKTELKIEYASLEKLSAELATMISQREGVVVLDGR